MISKTFDQIETADIQALIDNQTPEGKTLEYKQQLPSPKNKNERDEFLTDIISFANAAGGDVIYGVKEKRDKNRHPTGIPEAIVGLGEINSDEELRRLDSWLQTMVEPKIPGIRMKSIDCLPNGPVIIIRIPQSWMLPHSFKKGAGNYRFFVRQDRSKRPLDIQEIRSFFVASENLTQRIQRIRDVRLAKIVAGETPVSLPERAKIALHIISVQQLITGNQIDPHQAKSVFVDSGGLTLLGQYPAQTRLNLDGLLGYYEFPKGERTEIASYTQIFRDGYIEAVNIDLVESVMAEKIIAINLLEKAIINEGFEYLNFFSQLGFDPPFVVFISLLGVKGFHIPAPNGRIAPSRLMEAAMGIDRDYLTLPELLVEQYPSTKKDWIEMLHDTFDILWQTAGWRQSHSFDNDGNWHQT